MSDEEKVNLVTNSENREISLNWTNLSYVIKYREWPQLAHLNFFDAFQKKQKVILHLQSGRLKTGSLMAVMGKSGSGKSSLIELLSGNRTKGLKGNIYVTSKSTCDQSAVDLSKVKIAFLPQQECLIEVLTVEESIMYASKLKNHHFEQARHEANCEKLLSELNLERCRNVRLAKCSGGERKRVSIALELVSKPDILIVDEVTSGLDSNSAIQCVQTLRKLTRKAKNPLGILVSIHQPSIKILNEFDQLYLLSFDGRCIYKGTPEDLPSYLAHFNLHCPKFYNIADYAIEIASADHSEQVVNEMSEFNIQLDREINESAIKGVKISGAKLTNYRFSLSSSFENILILTKRTVITTHRDPVLYFLRLFVHVINALLMIALFGNTVGEESGCIQSESNSNGKVSVSFTKIHDKQMKVAQNMSLFVFNLFFFLYANMTVTIMAFPSEAAVFIKERTNGWYSCLSYYIAKTIAEIPLVFIMTTAYAFAIYYFTGQFYIFWRAGLFCGIALLVALIGQSIGLIIGALFVNNVNAAVFIGPIVCFPSMLFCGFFVKPHLVPNYLKPLAATSFLRYALEAIVICVYGFQRCIQVKETLVNSSLTIDSIFKFINFLNKLNITYSSARPYIQMVAENDNKTLAEFYSFDKEFENVEVSKLSTLIEFNVEDTKESFILSEFNIGNDQLLYEFIMLAIILIILRILVYFVLAFKAKTRE
ncbi:ABC transporter-like protein 12 [Dinothrombium tinctorium]|uniref:ABC transporter-like protein 12 n=1 Tax=Dinothrombium tinctorium TaxID=1965070 RepID=A0A443QXH3_9ACAR|nr:ABC transporter-like protein 12 [Dinothrombium tinctorium]